MAQQHTFVRKKQVMVAAGIVACLGLACVGVRTKSDRDDRSRELRDAIDGGPATNVTLFLGQSQDHTGSEVRIAAQGPQGANVVGITNQTDLFHTIARALGLE
jgi:alkaline phosphatase